MAIKSSILHRVFYLSVRESPTGKEVVKLPIAKDEYSCKLIRALKPPRAFEQYQAILKQIRLDPYLREHCVEVRNIRRDGGYTSDYVEGINLAELRDELLGHNVASESVMKNVISAINRLVNDLRCYCKTNGRLVGDWPLHNLVYSLKSDEILNVDSEGFFSWHNASEENDMGLIEGNLWDLKSILELLTNPTDDNRSILDILRLLDEVRRSGQEYSGNYFAVGYHSLKLRGRFFRGQRECSARLAQIPFDFRGKVVLDLGCNCGGMLHALSDKLRMGFGVDHNVKCVNAAQSISLLNNSSNLRFLHFDLDKDDLGLLKCFLVGQKVDICFLLSVCMWLKRWREVIEVASRLAETTLFESNGSPEQQEQQVQFLRKCYKEVSLVSYCSPDDPLQGARKLYLCLQAPQPSRPSGAAIVDIAKVSHRRE
jgi:hypothetical protein